MTDLATFKGTLPYASALFGIYQPLLGWRSKRIAERYDQERVEVYGKLADRIQALRPPVRVEVNTDFNAREITLRTAGLSVEELAPLRFHAGPERYIAPEVDTAVARMLSERLPEQPPQEWSDLVSYEAMSERLSEVGQMISQPGNLSEVPSVEEYVKGFIATATAKTTDQQAVMQALFERESAVAGYLAYLATHSASTLTQLFYRAPGVDLAKAMALADPLVNFGHSNYDAVLSPIGIVHLFREYFFEFDSFLGPPVGHQWLSPGGMVELIEVNTRKVFTERTVEMMTETTRRSESETTNQDEIADAVKEENRNDIKFGFTNVANYSAPTFQDTATASFSLDNAKTNTRETTHKQMRQQSEKLSSEIKKNFKTTFRTSTEVTDTSSKRYVLENKTDELVNYELRRKMRKVGVQVQDIGTQLCWTTFVDDPGREVGIAKLVHIAKPAELGDLVQPDAPPQPQPQPQELSFAIPFVGLDTDDTDNAYTDGSETEVGFGDSTEHIQADFPKSATFNQPGYTAKDASITAQGADANLSIKNLASEEGSSTATFTVHIDYVNWNGQNSIPATVTLLWEPTDKSKADAQSEYESRMSAYSSEKERRFKESFYTAARERIKAASSITPRTVEDLREEERTVVYRRLIKQLMSVGGASPHVTSELVRSIFDVDRMLYFVAPEWWAPRQHRSSQHLGETEGSGSSPKRKTGLRRLKPTLIDEIVNVSGIAAGIVSDDDAAPVATPIPNQNIVDWGGAKEMGRDNYYITEDSSPAKLGSSLGWLLQLDGDNLRNALLNSPWVKAVIPIRPGKEHAAINWLQQAHVEGSDGFDAQYSASPDDPPELQSTGGRTVTIKDALDYLIEQIQTYSRTASTAVMPNPGDPEDPANHFAGSLPTEAVFEHGFNPLSGGVHWDGEGTEQKIFSQWTEIMPTDQIVALQVEYDPKTLQIKVPE